MTEEDRRRRGARRWWRRIQNPFQNLYKWYWHHSEDWLILPITKYLKALFILVLWLFAGVCLFRLVLNIFGISPEGKEEKEIITLAGSLLTAIIGFGLQQWKGQEEEEQRRRQKEDEAISNIEREFSDLLQRDLSEGARRFVELRRELGVWQHSRVRVVLEEVWGKKAPVELRRAVAIIKDLPERKTISPQDSVAALIWAHEYLDQDWRLGAIEELSRLEQPRYLLETRDEEWWAVIGIWTEVSFETGLVSKPDRDLISGIHYLGLKDNPFSSEKAEKDPILLSANTAPSWWEGPCAGLSITVPGGGRTAAALLLARNALQERTAFPIYWRVSSSRVVLNDLLRVIAMTVARYIAIRPGSFVSSTSLRRAAISRLLTCYLPTHPLPYLREAGLSPVGEGKVLEEAFTSCSGISAQSSLSGREIYNLLGRSIPADFRRMWILVDVQESAGGEDIILNLHTLAENLDRFGVVLQAFLPYSASTDVEVYGRTCFWSDEDLRRLLRTRLLVGGDETLDAWCDLRRWAGQSAEDRLIAAAQGSPAALIRLGKALLCRIGRVKQKLCSQDLNDVLERK